MSSPPLRMATRRVGSLLLLYQGSEAPTDAEWDACLALLRPIAASARVLVITQGGGPNSAQRAKLAEVARKRPIVAAVVSDSIPVRFIVSCVALFMSRIRSYPCAEMEAAYRHLGLGATECELAQRHLAEMREQVLGASETPKPRLGRRR